jgi:O-methyltransferase
MIHQVEVNEVILDYIRKNSLRENEILKSLREETNLLADRTMQISPEQGQFISLLVRILNASKTLEIGVFTGYSALCAAYGLKQGGKVIACDCNEEWLSMASKYWKLAGVENKIDILFGDANITLNNLIKRHDEVNSYDFVFIDADKISYDHYYEYALKLLRPGGLIMLDNTLWSGFVADASHSEDETNALRAINKKLLNDNRVDLSMLPYSDGITLVVKR